MVDKSFFNFRLQYDPQCIVGEAFIKDFKPKCIYESKRRMLAEVYYVPPQFVHLEKDFRGNESNCVFAACVVNNGQVNMISFDIDNFRGFYYGKCKDRPDLVQKYIKLEGNVKIDPNAQRFNCYHGEFPITIMNDGRCLVNRPFAFQNTSREQGFGVDSPINTDRGGVEIKLRVLTINEYKEVDIPSFVPSRSIEDFLRQRGGGRAYVSNLPTSVVCPEKFRGDFIIPDVVKYIGNFAFENRPGLTSVSIPSGVKSIGDCAFHGCTGLKNVTIPYGVTSIGDLAFSGCSNLTTVIIPNSIKRIGYDAFCGCSSLTSIIIPKSVKEVGYGAFNDYDGWCGFMVVVPSRDTTSIKGNPFGGCSNLSNIIVENENAIYDSRNNCNAIIEISTRTLITGCKNTIIPKSVTNIGDSAFFGCTCLSSIIIPDSVKRIGESAFNRCTSLSSIEITDGVMDIGEYAFLKCTSLTSIIIPDSVTSIGDYAFSGCTGLSSVIISHNITSIGRGAFSGCARLTSIIIPDSVTDIGEYAFHECNNLTSIIIPDSVKRIGENAFSGCSCLTSLVIPNSVKRIENWAFSGCKSLTSLTIPNSVTHIGEFAFHECNNLTSLTILNRDTWVEQWAFSSDSNLQNIVVPIDSIERFCNMRGLQSYAEIIRKTAQTALREEYEQRLLLEQQRQELFQDSILFYDTETTGKPLKYKAPVIDLSNWPRLVQLAWIIADKEGNVLKKKSVIIKPDGFSIPADAVAVHGITTERAQREGLPLKDVLEEFATDLSLAEHVVGHNIDFDQHVVGAELCRLGMDFNALMDKPCTCTMKTTTNFCAIPNPNTYFGGYKWPSLQELYHKLFNRDFEGAHDALADITATKECFFELKRRGIIKE